ncbi:unnamed protein product [Closterium sp. NIES-64]|nr:unnamed protein product [Closterium sp. NIES-64]CAI5977533.1 unnamed protein product [Closterium sp. NIES-65]
MASLVAVLQESRPRRSAPWKVEANPMQGIWSKMRSKAGASCSNCGSSSCSVSGPALLPELVSHFGRNYLSALASASDFHLALKKFPARPADLPASASSARQACSTAAGAATAAPPSQDEVARLLAQVAAGNADSAAVVMQLSAQGAAEAELLISNGATASLTRALESGSSGAAKSRLTALTVATALNLCLLSERSAPRFSEEGLVMLLVNILRQVEPSASTSFPLLADVAALLYCLLHSEARVHVAASAGTDVLLWQLLVASSSSAPPSNEDEPPRASARAAAALALLRLSQVPEVAAQLVERNAVAQISSMLLAGQANGQVELSALLASLTRSEEGVMAFCTVDDSNGARALLQVLQPGKEQGKSLTLQQQLGLVILKNVLAGGSMFGQHLVQAGVREGVEQLLKAMGGDVNGKNKGVDFTGGQCQAEQQVLKVQELLSSLRNCS